MSHVDRAQLLSHLHGGDQYPDVADHLAGCAACSEELELLRDTMNLSREAALLHVDDRPPDELWAGIATAVRAEPAPPRARSGRRTLPLLAAAAAVGALAVLAAFQPWRSLSTTTHRGPLSGQAGAHGSVSVVSDHGSTRLTVAASGLTQHGGFFEVWLAEPKTGRVVSIGNLADGRGSFPVPASLDLSRYDAVAVSHERFDGNPAPSAEQVLHGALPH